MVRRYSRKTKQCTPTWYICLFQKNAKFFLSITQLHSLSYQYKRTLSNINKVSCMLKFYAISIGNRIVTTDKVKVHRFVIHHFCLCILGKVKHYRTWTTAFGNIKSTCYRPCYIFCSTNLITPFTDWLSNTY